METEMRTVAGYEIEEHTHTVWGSKCKTIVAHGKMTAMRKFITENEQHESYFNTARRDPESKEWYGATVQEAWESPLVGYPSIVKYLQKHLAVDAVNSKAERETKIKTADVSGSYIMPLVMQGNVPLCAQGQRKGIKRTPKTITLFYAPSLAWDVSVKQSVRAGAIAASVINALERQGLKVRFICGAFTARSAGAELCCTYEVKDYNSRLNPINLSVACHPATLRRIGFRLYEIIGDHYGITEGGYGCPLSGSQVREAVKPVYKDAVCITYNEARRGVDSLLEFVKEQIAKVEEENQLGM